MNVYDLKCEYLQNPLGIDEKRPRLSWKIRSDQKDVRQSAYQIQCKSWNSDFKSENNLLWDSTKIQSDQSIYVEYDGPDLESYQRVYWRSQIWDQDGNSSGWSEIAWWEMGILDPNSWNAKWIDPEGDIDPKEYKPASYLRKVFTISKKVEKARLYITSHGIYEAWLNGQRVGKQVFTPGSTVYNKRLQYQVYDITEMIAQSQNAIGVVLCDGFFRGTIGGFSKRNVYGERLALLAFIRVTYADGEILEIGTDNSWKTTQDGPIKRGDLKKGEIYDARKDIKNWSDASFDDTIWKYTHKVDNPFSVLIASMSVPILEHERFKSTVIKTPNEEIVLDFGQNLAGYVEMEIGGGNAGIEITLTHGEILDKDGNFTQKNISAFDKSAFQQDIYIHNGVSRKYKPISSVKGFRYVKIEGYPEEIKEEKFIAIAVYSAMSQTGNFTCSNSLINQFVQNTIWSQKGNFLDVPTDCPTRERSGWTGDAQVFCYTGSILLNTSGFFSKWMQDVAADQYPSGMIQVISPHQLSPSEKSFLLSRFDGSAGWGDAAVIIPWTVWKIYGDKRILARQYNCAKAWVDYEANNAKKAHWSRILNPKYWSGNRRMYKNYLWDTKHHFGEWLSADEKSLLDLLKGMLKQILLSEPEVATAYFSYSARLLSNMAEKLGHIQDSEHYKQLATNAMQAYQAFFLKDGQIKSKKQARFVRPLALGLVPTENIANVAKALNQKVIEADYHVGTGFLSTPFLLEMLSENGYLDTAYKLLLQTSQPSWLNAVSHGATTIWESWYGIMPDGSIGKTSLNHYSYGAAVSWLFKVIAGIKWDLENPGFKHFFIEPKPGGELKFAEAIFESPHGEILSKWEKNPNDKIQFRYTITIPPNSSATVRLIKSKNQEIKESNKSLSDSKGIHAIQINDNLIQFELESGKYIFDIYN